MLFFLLLGAVATDVAVVVADDPAAVVDPDTKVNLEDDVGGSGGIKTETG